MPTTAAASTTNASAPADPSIARGILREIVPASATKPGYIVFALNNSNYALHLRVPGGEESLRERLGKRLIGTIRCEARRVDECSTGGRFVEPVVGRPRKVQGAVLGHVAGENALVLSAAGASMVDSVGLPVIVKLTDARQKAAQFAIGTLVTMDVMDGATFTASMR
ncbi:MAG: hypothetical protein K2X32_05790 [Phycisphaerales bacterium]|nr:hypothetical protein [Phycisphaerales bacterium]